MSLSPARRRVTVRICRVALVPSRRAGASPQSAVVSRSLL